MVSSLPCTGGGTHQHIIQHEDPALFGLDNFSPVIVNCLDDVIRSDEVPVSTTQELEVQKDTRDITHLASCKGEGHS